MLLKANRFIPGSQIRAYCAFGIAFLLAIALRISLYHVITSDYTCADYLVYPFQNL